MTLLAKPTLALLALLGGLALTSGPGTEPTPTISDTRIPLVTGDGVDTPGASLAAAEAAGGDSAIGYWVLDRDGTIEAFGDAPAFPAIKGVALDLESAAGGGAWILTDDGVVHALGGATHFGNVDMSVLGAGEKPSSISGVPDGTGYWVFTDRGRVLRFGSAGFFGDLVQLGISDRLVGPVIDAVATATGNGYLMLGSDGGVFVFGDGQFRGSVPEIIPLSGLAAPLVGLVPDHDGVGYWLFAADGGIFSFAADFLGSVPGVLPPGAHLDEPVSGAIPYGSGYLLVATDGGVFNFSDRPFSGSAVGSRPSPDIISVAAYRPGGAVLPPAGLPPVISSDPAPIEGLWINREEILALPMSGPAWQKLVEVADEDPGQADISDQDSNHDIKVLAMAYVAVRTGDDHLRDQVEQELLEVIGTDENANRSCDWTPNIARSLAIGRNLVSYIIAADLIGLRPDDDPTSSGAQFASWVDDVRQKPNCPHTGSGSFPDGDWFNLSQFHDWSASNVSTMAGASRIAAALYLGDESEVEAAWETFQRYAGDLSVGPDLKINDKALTWSSQPDRPVAVNPAGAVVDGHNVDGAIINDIARGGEFAWPPEYTQYPWEGLAGFYVQAELLQRAGYPAWEAGDEAGRRAIKFLERLADEFGDQWWDHTDWAKYLANDVYGLDLPINGPASKGKNMAWTDWTHPGT